MNQSDILQKIRPILADKLAVEDHEITLSAHFKDDLGADSLDMVDALMEIEKEFDTAFTDEEMEQVKTVQHAVDLIEKNLASK